MMILYIVIALLGVIIIYIGCKNDALVMRNTTLTVACMDLLKQKNSILNNKNELLKENKKLRQKYILLKANVEKLYNEL